ncbi:hypothetical protein [Bacillus coreaensis]
MKDWKINKEQYEKLLHYIGSGDLPNAKIIVFGNEEGVGGNPVYANVEAREKYFGKKDGENFYSYTIDPEGDYKKGFWNPSAIEGENRVFRIMEENKHELPKKGFTKGGFLQYCSRICLAIEDNKNDISYWFEPINENHEAKKEILKYIRDGLFQPKKTGIQTFLMDWRPLPRPNENWWGDEYSKSIDRKSYLKAFNLTSSRKDYEDQFSNYSEDVITRNNILKNAVIYSNAKVLIGLGNIDTKQKFIKEILDLSDSDFKEFNIEGVNVRAVIGNKKFRERDKDLSIFLLPFPLSGHASFKNGYEMNSFFLEVTKKIKSILNNIE